MRRGTTPTLKFNTSVDLTEAEKVFITFSQNGIVVIEKSLPEIEISEDGLIVTLQQNDTLKFKDNEQYDVQIRALIKGAAIASNIMHGCVKRVLKEGEI